MSYLSADAEYGEKCVWNMLSGYGLIFFPPEENIFPSRGKRYFAISRSVWDMLAKASIKSSGI